MLYSGTCFQLGFFFLCPLHIKDISSPIKTANVVSKSRLECIVEETLHRKLPGEVIAEYPCHGINRWKKDDIILQNQFTTSTGVMTKNSVLTSLRTEDHLTTHKNNEIEHKKSVKEKGRNTNRPQKKIKAKPEVIKHKQQRPFKTGSVKQKAKKSEQSKPKSKTSVKPKRKTKKKKVKGTKSRRKSRRRRRKDEGYLKTHYEVTTQTGTREHSSTDCHVYVIVHGTKDGNSTTLHLYKEGVDVMGQGANDTFKFNSKLNLGRIKKFVLKVVRLGIAPGWFLKAITLKRTDVFKRYSRQEVYYAEVNKWFQRSDGLGAFQTKPDFYLLAMKQQSGKNNPKN